MKYFIFLVFFSNICWADSKLSAHFEFLNGNGEMTSGTIRYMADSLFAEVNYGTWENDTAKSVISGASIGYSYGKMVFLEGSIGGYSELFKNKQVTELQQTANERPIQAVFAGGFKYTGLIFRAGYKFFDKEKYNTTQREYEIGRRNFIFGSIGMNF